MWTTRVQTTLALRASPGLVQVTVPLALAQSGVVALTNVVPPGTRSVRVNPPLSDGPWFLAVIGNGLYVPAVAMAAAVLVMSRTAERLTGVCEVELLASGPGSAV